MMYYKLIFEYKTDDDIGRYGTYGIAVYHNGKLIETVGDISCDKEKITALTDSFNAGRLEYEHFAQAVEEFLYDFEG